MFWIASRLPIGVRILVAMMVMNRGITLSNRAVLLGLTTAADLTDLAEAAHQVPASIQFGAAMRFL